MNSTQHQPMAPNLQIRSSGQAVQDRPMVSALWADVPGIAPHDRSADRRTAQHLSVPGRRGWGALRGGRRLPSLDPSGHVGAAARAPPRPTVRTSRRNGQCWCASCERWPPLRHPIMKPRKIVVKGALRASLARSLRDPGPRVLPRFQSAPVGGMAASERRTWADRIAELAETLRWQTPHGNDPKMSTYRREYASRTGVAPSNEISNHDPES